MALFSKEHYEMLEAFERLPFVRGYRLDKEDKAMWPKGYIYQHGELNQIFLVYRHGVAFGEARAMA
jgi:hypothetical protein